MKELTRWGLIFAAAALASVGVFSDRSFWSSCAISTFARDEPPLETGCDRGYCGFRRNGANALAQSEAQGVARQLAMVKLFWDDGHICGYTDSGAEIPYSGRNC